MTEETREGPTPNGGVRSKIIYQDRNGQPVDKNKAVQAVIFEYDAQGNQIARTYGKLRAR